MRERERERESESESFIYPYAYHASDHTIQMKPYYKYTTPYHPNSFIPRVKVSMWPNQP